MLNKFEKAYLSIINQNKKPSRRHIIKEWSYDDFVKVNKDRMNKILDRILSQYRDLYKQELMNCVENDMKHSYHHDDPADPEETAAYVLEKYEYIFRQSDKLYDLLTDEEKVNFEKYCDRFLEGMEGYVYDMYGGGGGYYDEVCEMDPVYKEIVDEINQRNGGPKNADEYAEQSVKKPISKRRLIKESAKPRRYTRKLIKEDRLSEREWEDMLQEKFDGVVKGICEKYPNELINSIDTSYFSSDPEDNACQILDGLFVDLIDRFPQNLLTERDKKWIGKYSDQWEGCEGLWSDYGWGGHDVGAYKCLREKFPVLADFVDKYVKEHPYEGTNARYHITDPRAENPPYPVNNPTFDQDMETDSFHESKKVNTSKKVIKESAKRSVKHVKRIKK